MIKNPKFVYTGQKEDFIVRWFNLNIKNTKAKLDKNGNFILTIVVDNYGRITNSFKTPIDAIEYAKKKIIVKSLPKQRKYAEGKARILWIDENSGKEYDAAIVIKKVKRYYEPVSRFNHNEE